ncbi:L,D-transpeptidase [Allonocardiopsis opalescens]|uniref:Lipoprotein-anchoring transpeptidase ErfK/SrfK n=1 Tax=Allonocardiopsis opalescens TaxID=1144618 RepID=A0A2T0PZT6_9ACTN|nr:Ig-like domain-containing protein [Allonocardiopsis opalescens]PRX97047.1 lipoprotein-anchoring transpeptidase ErfK/SrfK [Allonocardiopsis opalescens]
MEVEDVRGSAVLGRRKLAAALSGIALVFAAACQGGGTEASGTAGGGDPAAPEAAQVEIVPADGGADVRPDQPIVVTAATGTIEDVVVERAGGGASASPAADASAEDGGEQPGLDEVTGTLNDDSTVWTSTWTLHPGTEYTVTATAAIEGGEPTTVTSSFTTLTPEATVSVTDVTPQGDETVGVGLPIIVTFDREVHNKELVERALEVRSEEPAEGAWNWLSDTQAVFRTSEYWAPNQTVTLNARMAGVRSSQDVYGVQNSSYEFNIGDSQIFTVDTDSHRMTVEVNGEEVQDFPISAGNETTRAYTTTSGVHINMEKYEDLVMDSATVGIPEGHPDYYRIEARHAVRISNSGEFHHGAPWNGQLGQANTSHGCVNLSAADAEWVYNHSQRGDITVITGTDRELEWNNGWGFYQLSWDEWLGNSNLDEPWQTGPDAAGPPALPESASASPSE